ncbi:helix-turn-helix domain-containing protein [Streptomyces sp. DT171]|uniref:helix-turn-helix domain-containing protein n=1 Tax=Streptomyces sp. DT171 TaxID=3416524 RepID=UPI003CF52F1E
MPPRTVTTARQRRLGTELRKMREAAGLNAREASALLGIDHTKISHMETARSGVGTDRLRVLASCYGCSDDLYLDALIKMASERERGWWEEYRELLPAGFLDLTELEDKSTYLRTYQIAHLPGLMQTEDYARAVFEFTFPRLPEDHVEARIAHRIKRSKVLDRKNGTEFSAVIHEAALRMRFGGRAMARTQLDHLLKLSEHPNCTVRVLPFTADGFAGSGQAVLYAGGPVPSLDTVHLDFAHGAAFLDATAQLDAYRDLLSAMEDRSLDVTKSRDLIKEIAHTL